MVPDLVAGIISRADTAGAFLARVEEYFQAGVHLVWVIYPENRKVYAYDSPTSVRILQDGDELDGNPVLPGFRFPLSDLFEPKQDGPSPVA